MKATKLYRTASVLLFLAALGNTFGLLNFWHVAAPLPPVRFPIGHAPFSYAMSFLATKCSALSVFCLQRTWLGIWGPWLEGRLKPLAQWDGSSLPT